MKHIDDVVYSRVFSGKKQPSLSPIFVAIFNCRFTESPQWNLQLTCPFQKHMTMNMETMNCRRHVAIFPKFIHNFVEQLMGIFFIFQGSNQINRIRIFIFKIITLGDLLEKSIRNFYLGGYIFEITHEDYQIEVFLYFE